VTSTPPSHPPEDQARREPAGLGHRRVGWCGPRRGHGPGRRPSRSEGPGSTRRCDGPRSAARHARPWAGRHPDLPAGHPCRRAGGSPRPSVPTSDPTRRRTHRVGGRVRRPTRMHRGLARRRTSGSAAPPLTAARQELCARERLTEPEHRSSLSVQGGSTRRVVGGSGSYLCRGVGHPPCCWWQWVSSRVEGRCRPGRVRRRRQGAAPHGTCVAEVGQVDVSINESGGA
jgi:hypothetical protein